MTADTKNPITGPWRTARQPPPLPPAPPPGQAPPLPAGAAPPLPPASSAGPLLPQHMQELAAAGARAKRLLRAAKVASFNGWATGIFAALSIPFGLLSLTALVMGVGLALISWNEFRGRKLLVRFDLRGPRVLGCNQLALCALLVGGSAWCIASTLLGPDPYAAQIAAMPELNGMLGSITELNTILTVGIYGAVIVFSLIFQGLNAAYYFTRRKALSEYLRQTPAWVVELQRASAGL